MPTHMPMLVCTHRSTHTCIYTSLYVSVYICQRTRPCTCLCTQMIYLFMHYALSNVPVTMKTSPAIVYKRPCDCARAVQEPNPRRDLVSTIACTCGRACMRDRVLPVSLADGAAKRAAIARRRVCARACAGNCLRTDEHKDVARFRYIGYKHIGYIGYGSISVTTLC